MLSRRISLYLGTMENGTPEGINGSEACSHFSDEVKDMEEVTLQIAQLQAVTSELKTGLMDAIQGLSTLRLQDSSIEDRMMSHQSEMDEEIQGIKNSLSTFKEDLSTALSQIKEINGRQKDMQQHLELFQTEMVKVLHSVQARRGSREDALAGGCQCPPGQPEISVIQHYFASLPSGSPHRSVISIPGTASPVQEAGSPQSQGGAPRSPVWSEYRDSTDGQAGQGIGKRGMAALELLDSERVYVSYLSLLLKANITFNGSEAIHVKDKRPFPSSLRFLIQQHVTLLHVLQERVLRRRWRGIIGDVFLRLAGKESDFLDYYVAYLKELPECLAAVNMYSATSVKSTAFSEVDITGDETRPPLHTLLLHPVQRIPEYLLLLQKLLKQTDAEHPDYYLLVVCIQQFRAFTSQYSHLLQHNEDLLLKNHKELKRTAMKQFLRTMDCGIQEKRAKQKLPEQVHGRQYQDWEAESWRYDSLDGTSPVPFFAPDADPRLKPSGLQSIPEMDQESPSTEPPPCRHPGLVSTVSEPAGLVLSGALSLDGLCEDGDSFHNTLLFDNCSSASSDSSIDIAFIRCPKSRVREQYSGGRGRDGGYKHPGRGRASPDEAGLKRHRPLQAVQRKTKSLNGLQLDSPIGTDGCSADLHSTLHQQAKPEPQSSKVPTNRKLQRSISPPHKLDTKSRAATQEELRKDHKESMGQSPWPDESRWRVGMEENRQSNFSEKSRKQDQKGGFRSSFKKLFKKKSGGDGKEKAADKSEIHAYSDNESAKTPRSARLGDVDRGTAV